ncbi:MAG: hypothetical protein R3F60_04330 [bacterium]
MLLAALAALGVASCGEASRGRVCEPVRQTGCPKGRACAVEEDGVPLCVQPAEGAEGDLCEDAAACGAGLGCVRAAGVARCLRFCLPTDTDATDFAPCLDGRVPPTEVQGSRAARCVAAVIDRPDIGVCLLPCRPLGALDCPEGLACQPSLAAGMTVCAVPGEAGRGDACGPDTACQPGLACVPEGAALVCRPYATDAGCPVGQRERAIAGVVLLAEPNALTGDVAESELRVCVPN